MRRANTPLLLWIAQEVLPHEPALRRWLRGTFPQHQADDVIQESYCRLAELDGFAHITDPRGYLFQTARNVVLADIRRARVVRIEAAGSLADIAPALIADELDPERIVAGRGLLGHVEALIGALPDRARAILRLRKLDGLSQREIAERMGVTETIVENDLARGLRTVLAGLSEDERAELPTRQRMRHGRTPLRRRH